MIVDWRGTAWEWWLPLPVCWDYSRHTACRLAANLLWPTSFIAGVLSVAWFAATGSITPYAVLQFGGIAMIAGALWLPTHGKGPNWAALIGAYALAKLLEAEDVQVFHLTQGALSGHTLKHLFAALAVLAVLVPLAPRSRPKA